MVKLIGLTGLMVVTLALLGCSTLPTALERDYGTSFKLAKFNQILNSEAEKNLEPVTGMNGVAAQGAIEKYQKGFKEKEAAPTYVFSISTGAK